MSKVSLRERQHKLREEVILAEAETLLMEYGFERMNMDELAAKVGISKATLYQHFASKEDLVVAVVVQHAHRLHAYLEQEADGKQRALERLRRALRSSLRMRFKQYNSMLPEGLLRLHPVYQAQLEALAKFIQTLLEQARQEGEINPNLHLPVVARAILSLFRSDYDHLLQQQDTTLDQLIDTLVTMTCNGIMPPVKPSSQP